MIGIRIVNSLNVWIYESLIFCGIAGFAVYDMFKRQVRDKALVLLCLAAAISPLIHAWPFIAWPLLLLYFLYFLSGAAMSFLILLGAAIFSKHGDGIGGGDIKLAAVMGFIYGPLRMTTILLIASALASVTALAIQRKPGTKKLSLPFVPFLAIGSLAVTIVTFIK